MSKKYERVTLGQLIINSPSFAIDTESGILRNVSIISVGPALGYNWSVTESMIQSVCDLINAKRSGVKVHLGHPDVLNENGLCSLVGKCQNARIDANRDRVVADIVLKDYANTSPQGQLKSYVLQLAQDDASAFGISVSFDYTLEDNAIVVSRLVSVDIVDDPAANPNGLLEVPHTEGTEQLDNNVIKEEIDMAKKLAETPIEESVKETQTIESEVQPVVETESLSEQKTETINLEAEKENAVQLERQRVADISNLCNSTGHKQLIDNAVKQGLSVADVKEQILKQIQKEYRPVETRITVGEDLNRTSLQSAIQDHFALRCGAKIQPHERVREFSNAHSIDICKAYLNACGIDTSGMSRLQIANTALNPRICLTHTTSDFANILVNGANVALQQAYQEAPVEWQKWCNVQYTSDTRPSYSVQLNAMSNFPVIDSGQEYPYTTVGDRKETFTLVKNGNILEITDEVFLADQTNALARLPQAFAFAAARTVDAKAFAILTGGVATVTTADGGYVFNATAVTTTGGHANYSSATGYVGAPSTTLLDLGKSIMRKQVGGGTGSYLNLEPKWIIVPAELEGAARRLVQSPIDPTATYNSTNIYQGTMGVIASGVLSAASANVWYLAADKNVTDTVCIGLLQGEENPRFTEDYNFKTDSRQFKCRHFSVAFCADWRGLYCNKGA